MTGVPTGLGSTDGRTPVDPVLAAEWLACLGELAGPAGHELRNALNGVAVNLEVVRSRSSRPDMPASSVASYAIGAAGQVEQLATLSEALLSLLRPQPEPLELHGLVRRLATLLGATTAEHDGHVTVSSTDPDATWITGGRAASVRLATASVLLAAFDRSGTLSCELVNGVAPAVHLRRPGGILPPPPTRLLATAGRAGVTIEANHHGWVVTFPPPGADRAPA